MICTCTGGLSSSLVSSRKQEAATSCKACGGRPSVNGIGSLSASMMSTVGLELANSLNADLAWKTVSKGYKRAPRRARKLVSKNFKVDMELVNKSTRRADDTAVSESEKLGVAVLGRRFSEKVEHVPIKKRRFMFRSPSPPPQSSSSRLEVSGIQQASGQRSCPNSVAKPQLLATDFGGSDGVGSRKFSEVTNENLGYIEDFSGIEILAAAACENSVGDDADHGGENRAVEKSMQEGIDSSTSASHLDETIASLETTNNSSHEDKIKDSSFQDNKEENLCSNKDDKTEEILCSNKDDKTEENLCSNKDDKTEENLCSNKDDKTVESSVSVRDDRLHWDLNVSMDDWEQPCDVDSQTEALENISVDSKQDETPQVFEGCGVQRESENIKHGIEGAEQSTVDGVVSSDVHGDIDMPKDLRDLALGTCRSNAEEHELQSCSGFDTIHDKCSLTIADNALESSTYDFAIIKACTQVISMNRNVDVDPSPGSDITNTVGSEKNSNTSFDSVIAKHEADVALPYVPVSKKATCEIDGTIKKEDGADSGTASALRDFKNSPQRIMSLASFIPSEPVSLEVKPVIESAQVESHHPECKCEDTSASGASVEEGQPAVTEDAKGQVDKASMLHNAVVDSSVHVESEELLHKCSGDSVINLGAEGGSTSHEAHKNCGDSPSSSSRKDSTGDPSNAGCDLDVSQVDKNHIFGQENAVQLQAGYDSQYEDGELRESDVHYWDENEGDYAELECVDYESDNMDTYDDADDYLMSEKVPVGDECKEERFCGIEAKKIEKNVKVQRGLSSGSDNVIERMEHYTTGDAVREPSVSSKTKTSGSDHLPGGCEISGKMSVEVSEGRTIRKHSDDYMDGLINDKDCPVRVVGPRLSMKDNLIAQRSRSDNFDFCTRTERDDASDHSIARDRSALYGRNPGGGHLINPSTGYWESKPRPSPTYYDSYGSGRPRPKSVIESRGFGMDSDHTLSEAVGVAGVDNRVYRPPIRRRFPTDREDGGFGLRRGMVPPARDVNSDRRFRRYPPQGVNRGPREEYHRPQGMDDPSEYSYRMHPMPRRDNSISPPSRGRPLHYTRPYKKSQSRSRSRSPVAWSMPREQRNEGSRHRSSRSPDYRFETRMKRVRLPLQKPNFATDYEVGIMSPPRRRFSPKRNSRWFDDPNGAEDHFRGRRLPMRTFRQNQRFDPPRRLDSDEYFEPMMRPARFVDMPGAGRGRRFEGSDDDRRKPGGRYEIIHRVRRYDTDGVVRRFRYDEEECLVQQQQQNSHNFDECDRGADNRRPREVPRRVSEDKGHLRYNHDRLFNTSPNSFGVQDA